MFSIFKKKGAVVADISWLGVDLHSHLLPGIDDGCKNLDESLAYITRLHGLGFSKLICTPHIFTELYPNTPETISTALKLVQDSIEAAQIDIEVSAAAEYMVDETFKINDSLMCLPGRRILVEMSYLYESPDIEQIIFDLQIKGYVVILAHPERYNFYHEVQERYKRLKDMGCLFQLNLLSVAGYYGKGVAKVANYLLKNELYDFAGTDLHHENHLMALEKIVLNGRLYEEIGHYSFKNKQI